MTIREALDRDVLSKNLLEHPFYRAWSAGTLPAETLAAYAREYGAFVATLDRGWMTLSDAETAEEEREHARLWDAFAAALGTEVGEATVPQVHELSHLPIIVDPSHATGRPELIPSCALAGVAAGADGVHIEVHDKPEEAMSDGPQALLPDQYAELMAQIRKLAVVMGKQLS